MTISIIITTILYSISCFIVVLGIAKKDFSKINMIFVVLTEISVILSIYNKQFEYLFIGLVIGFCPLIEKIRKKKNDSIK